MLNKEIKVSKICLTVSVVVNILLRRRNSNPLLSITFIGLLQRDTSGQHYSHLCYWVDGVTTDCQDGARLWWNSVRKKVFSAHSSPTWSKQRKLRDAVTEWLRGLLRVISCELLVLEVHIWGRRQYEDLLEGKRPLLDATSNKHL
jgi:hypothetical protein